jgi:hypothetical protein
VSAPVYTKTFQRHKAPDTWFYYVVPDDHVAIITSVAATNGNAAGGTVYVYAGDIALWFGQFQVPFSNDYANLRCEVSAGERIGMYLQGPQLSGQVTGFLFKGAAIAATKPVEEYASDIGPPGWEPRAEPWP